MKEEKDIRWLQRLDNYDKAFRKMQEVVENKDYEELSDLEQEGLIQRFEYTFELAWKVLKDFLQMQGYIDIKSPNDTLKQAFNDGYIKDNDKWREMANARNITSHTYDENDAQEVICEIYNDYYPLLQDLHNTLKQEEKKFKQR
jgi:nucleotidyltransferase substrate binding protein (TIGR01987 family)